MNKFRIQKISIKKFNLNLYPKKKKKNKTKELFALLCFIKRHKLGHAFILKACPTIKKYEKNFETKKLSFQIMRLIINVYKLLLAIF